MNKPPKDYLTDRVKEFDEKFSLPPENIGDTAGIGYVPKRRPIFEPYEKVRAFLTQSIQQSMEVGREDGYTQGYTDGKNFDSRANEVQTHFNKLQQSK